MTLWLYLHFPSLQLDTLCSSEEQQTQAVVIVDERSHQVLQASHNARQAGIKPGMGIATAASLCASLQVHPAREEESQGKITEIAQQLYSVTSDMVRFEPDGLLLKVSDMLTLYASLENYWRAVRCQLDELGYRFHYATACSPLAARLLARNGMDRCLTDPQQLNRHLADFPLRATDLASKTIESLERVGIRELGGLMKLPWPQLAKRFDSQLVTWLGRLSGQFHTPVEFFHPPQQFQREMDLLYELKNLQNLEKPLLRLLGQLELYLRQRDLLALDLLLELRLRNDESVPVPLASGLGEYQAEKWWQLAQLRFESVRLSAPVIHIRLSAGQLTGQQGHCQDLFDRSQGAMPTAALVALLQAKLGDQAVRGIALGDDPRPELASLVSPPLNTPQKSASQKPAPKEPDPPALPLRPGLLLPVPRPLKEKVTLLQGPERIATGWWDEHQVTRDYFIARNTQGQWLWVYRTPAMAWFVHGMFC